MPIRIKPDGTFEVDSVDEAMRMSAAIEAKKAAAMAAKTPATKQQSAPWATFAAILREKPSQAKLIGVLKRKGALSLPQLCTEVGVASVAELTGIISGVQKNAKKAGLDLGSVIKRVPEHGGRGDVVSYEPTDALMGAAEVPADGGRTAA